MIFPPFDRYLVTLRMTRPAGFHFNHGGAINGLLCAAFGEHRLPEGAVPFACESGRVRFEAGEPYNFGLTLIGEARRLGAALQPGLARLGRTGPDRSQSLPALQGNFEVEAIIALPPPDLDAELAALVGGASRITLRFVSPLRIERRKALRKPGGTFVNERQLPALRLLRGLWGRIFWLSYGRSASTTERDTQRPSLPTDLDVTEREVTWLRVPRGGFDHDKRDDSCALGGLLGYIALTGVTEEWLPWLVLGSHIHLGGDTAFGFGRYQIDSGNGKNDPFRPGKRLLESLASPKVLGKALDHVVGQSDLAGVDGVAPAGLLGARGKVLATLAGDLSADRYKASPLRGFVLPESNGRGRLLAVPTVRDRIAQCATHGLLSTAMEKLFEDRTPRFGGKRSGRAGGGDSRICSRSRERFKSETGWEESFSDVDWAKLTKTLEPLYPGEALIGLLRDWAHARVEFMSTLFHRQYDLL